MNKQKKLMILGGSSFAIPVIEAAHKLGVYVITCDYLPNNIAHKYSDEYCNVSIIEKEEVLKVARQLEIDGITSFACDPGVITAAYIAEQMGLPNVGPYESVCILQNKGRFRKFLKDHNFNTPWSKAYKNVGDALNDDHSVHSWPVIVKPTDSAGSKGVKRVDKKEDLKEAINNALDSSISKEFIIEEFIDKSGNSSDTDSFSINGKLNFVSFNDQLFDSNANNPFTPSAYIWPASMNKEDIEYLRSEIERLIKLLAMKTSIYNIETRVGVDGKPYIMELSPRGGGNRLCEVIRFATGVDLISEFVKYCVGIKMDDIKQSDFSSHWGEIILHADKEGKFEDLIISDEIRKNIVDKQLFIKKGDMVHLFSGANQAIGTLILNFSNKEELIKVLNNQKDYINVIINND